MAPSDAINSTRGNKLMAIFFSSGTAAKEKNKTTKTFQPKIKRGKKLKLKKPPRDDPEDIPGF